MGWDLVILPVSCCFEYTPPQSPIPRMNCEHEDKMTASLRRSHCSPAAGPLDDDDLLAEILLRLPPQPSSLPRASAVCSRWRSLVADPGFSRRFRIHHSRRNPPPLLGCFSGGNGLSFEPALATPNRVPPERFSLQIDDGEWLYSHGCRHGLVLVLDLNRNQFLVWDPVTGNRHHLVVPPGFDPIHGAVLRAAGDVQFQVVLVMTEIDHEAQHTQAVARVYSSQTGLWSNLIPTPLPPEAYQVWYPTRVCPQPAVLVGDALYWMLSGKLFEGILEFNLDTQRLAVIHVPVNMFEEYSCFTVIRAEGGGMGFLVVFSFAAQAQLWKQLWTDCDGVVSWGLERTIQLDKLLSPNSERWIRILGYAEDNNRVFMGTPMGLFMVQLQSLKFKKLSETYTLGLCHPFESVYAAEKGIGGRHDGAEIPHNT